MSGLNEKSECDYGTIVAVSLENKKDYWTKVKLDEKEIKNLTNKISFKKLEPGIHVLKLQAKDAAGNLICPNGRKFLFKRKQHVRYNKYGRTEEIYECESCEGCSHKQECCPKACEKRTIRMNQELTSIHQEVLTNLESIHGALLRMNRSIQAEGTFGVLKWDKSYKRLFRRGEKNVILELTLISCGFNLYKYHNKKQRQLMIA